MLCGNLLFQLYVTLIVTEGSQAFAISTWKMRADKNSVACSAEVDNIDVTVIKLNCGESLFNHLCSVPSPPSVMRMPE